MTGETGVWLGRVRSCPTLDPKPQYSRPSHSRSTVRTAPSSPQAANPSLSYATSSSAPNTSLHPATALPSPSPPSPPQANPPQPAETHLEPIQQPHHAIEGRTSAGDLIESRTLVLPGVEVGIEVRRRGLVRGEVRVESIWTAKVVVRWSVHARWVGREGNQLLEGRKCWS